MTRTKSGFNASAVVLLGAAVLILLWALALFLTGGFQSARNREFAAKTYEPANPELEKYRAEQRAILDEKARWLDREQGTVVMPIEDAKTRIVEKLGGE
jgi:capsid protein